MEVIEEFELNSAVFKHNYLNSKPVVYRNVISNWGAVKNWSGEYFRATCPDMPIVTKEFKEIEVVVEQSTMGEYIQLLESSKKMKEVDATPVPYCHDIPIFLLEEKLLTDIDHFPKTFLPRWYRDEWWKYVQFFMSQKGSVTPLHFDTLMTSNLFFQIKGSKRFTIFNRNDSKYCYRKGWRWFYVNPESPDLKKHPDYSMAKPVEVVVNEGDVLYMPPAALHHVRSLDDCISFNVDFHTTKSLLLSLSSSAKGMPRENMYYNFISFLGVTLRLPRKFLFERYKSYLSYVS